MRKIAPNVATTKDSNPSNHDEVTRSTKREKASTRVMMHLALVDLALTGVPYTLQLYPTFFDVSSLKIYSPLTFVGSLLVTTKPAVNFFVFWRMIPTFRETILKMFNVNGVDHKISTITVVQRN